MMLKLILDKLIGCVAIEKVGYLIEGEAIWRESVSYCERCGLVIYRSKRRIHEEEFWEDDSVYLMSLGEP